MSKSSYFGVCCWPARLCFRIKGAGRSGSELLFFRAFGGFGCDAPGALAAGCPGDADAQLRSNQLYRATLPGQNLLHLTGASSTLVPAQRHLNSQLAPQLALA